MTPFFDCLLKHGTALLHGAHTGGCKTAFGAP